MLGLDTFHGILFLFCIVCACSFEFVNGFHDTANAVATVIYTGSLKPRYAVIWSGLCNFLGVMVGGIGVAMSIVNLLPLSDLASQGTGEGSALVLGMLLTAIIWNVGTWYFGIPCSSSHTMIGSSLGVAIVFHHLHASSDTVNWTKASEIGMSLLLSPLFGFALSILLMYLGRQFIADKKQIFKEPEPGSQPPGWIRAILITTCTGVSFFHGSNDGQKGVGLVLIILMIFFPLDYAINGNIQLSDALVSVGNIEQVLKTENKQDLSPDVLALRMAIDSNQASPTAAGRLQLRKRFLKLTKSISAELKGSEKFEHRQTVRTLKTESENLRKFTDFAPTWVIVMISMCLGVGTMIGWKRIVVTIGEKIGKNHMTYAEGATAEIVAAATIGVSSGFGLPVSTTHVLSSGVAGAMTASKGVKNLQAKTINQIILAWVLTLPVCVVLSGLLYYLLRMII